MGRSKLVPKMVWRVKLAAELEPGFSTEVEVGRLERDEQLTAALQAEMVPAQVTMVGERRRSCEACVAFRPAKVITVRRSAPCSATRRSGFGACLPIPARIRARQGASPSSTLRRRPGRA
jgi:hypothetical protein